MALEGKSTSWYRACTPRQPGAPSPRKLRLLGAEDTRSPKSPNRHGHEVREGRRVAGDALDGMSGECAEPTIHEVGASDHPMQVRVRPPPEPPQVGVCARPIEDAGERAQHVPLECLDAVAHVAPMHA